MKHTICLFVLLAVHLHSTSTALGQGRTIARLFWQDNSAATLRYGDLKKSADGWTIDSQSVQRFPALDVTEQSLVQMQSDSGIVLVGVHDHADGTLGSGWVAIDSGATEESHGDHSHWRFNGPASVMGSQINTTQGNPAHVYLYGRTIVLANDKKNGFTTTNAARLRDAKTPDAATTFHRGGNGHVTLAVVDDQVAYATWIARDGEDCGRVDVVGLGVNEGKRYSFQCPSGGLHGATTNSGKVFFAPSDGVCWVAADTAVNKSSDSVQVQHLALGKDNDDQPLRTGAFTNLDNTVLFVTGKHEDAKLCWIDASSDSPAVQSLSIELSEGDSLLTPVTTETRTGKRLALVFRENKESPESDALLVVDCDPDGNGIWDDASLINTISVGRNQIQGHSGRHDACVLPGGRYVAISNPADGTLSIVSLIDFTVTATMQVQGVPTRMTAVGG